MTATGLPQQRTEQVLPPSPPGRDDAPAVGPRAPWTRTALGWALSVLVPTGVFFLVVKPVNRLMGGRKEEEPTARECPH